MFNQDTIPVYIKELLKNPPKILSNFPYDDMMEFLLLGNEERFLEDEVVIKGDEYINSAYLVIEGSVILIKNNIPVISLPAGSLMGETFLFSKNYRMLTVVSEKESRLLRYGRAETIGFFKKKEKKLFHIFTRNIITVQQQKINVMNSHMMEMKKRLGNTSDT